jgi:SAM-dependent methyltransferase
MGPKALRLGWMLLLEAFGGQGLERRPEPTSEMDDVESVRAFHEQGSPSGPLLPVYHFNALATSRLVARGGTLVDLGCGSGQYLAYLAQRRPDIRILGLDLSPVMLGLGRELLAEKGLSGRVELREGDMTCFASTVTEHVDAVSSVFSLHHLPEYDALGRCVDEMARVRDRCGCAVWIFDHVRPRHPRTPSVFPEIFTPDAPLPFREDSRNSLMASFGFEELSAVLDRAGIGAMEHRCARFMRLYQVHWLRALEGSSKPAGDHLWKADRLPPSAARELKGLRALFPDVLAPE